MSKEEAIEILKAYKQNLQNSYSNQLYEDIEAFDIAIKALEERPQGKWIRYRNNPHQPEHIKCSNCGQYWSVADHDKTFEFCFNCGADMRGRTR